MCITVVLTALSGMMASSALSTEPAWMTEYGKARQQGQKEEKPLAVFVGAGKTGWEQVSHEGKFAKEVKQLLAQKYVCVYVNRDDEAGQKLASAFEFADGPGLIISSRAGNLQAFRHEGNLGNEVLEEYLRRYADPARVTTQTETNPSARMSYYSPASLQNTAPVQVQPAAGAPASFRSVGRSC
jgi:hypothetical protein